MIYAFEDFELDEDRRELRQGGSPVELQLKPLELLLYLVRHCDRAVPKDELFDEVWPGVVVSEAALSTALWHIRKALGDDASQQRFLQTRRGRGFRFVAPVTTQATPAATPRPGEHVFVGRGGVLKQLQAALDGASASQGRIVLLLGEPGIGKTRLAEELENRAGVRGVQVRWGRCWEGDGAPAFWPWVQLVRTCVREVDDEALENLLGPEAALIAGLVPELGSRLPDLPRASQLEPEAARFRLFDGIATFLKNASARNPLVLILDDLHWADRPSLRLLQFLAAEIHETRILVLGTYRDVEVDSTHPLVPVVSALERHRGFVRIALRAFAEDEVAALVKALAGSDFSPALLRTVFQLSEGNPFFVQELVRDLAEHGALLRDGDPRTGPLPERIEIPEGLRGVIGRRLSRLSEPCREALAIASVLGREFEMSLLQRIGDHEGERLLRILDEAVAARVLAEVLDAPGRYRFAHALVRETLYEELGAARRVPMHRRIAGTLEDIHRQDLEPHLAELAYHFGKAALGGDTGKAFDYAVGAGRRSMDLLAHEKAADHYRHALQILDLTETPDQARRCELMLDLGESQNLAGDAREAVETLWSAARLARSLGHSEALARAALELRTTVWFQAAGVPYREASSLLEEALDALGTGHSALRARLLADLAMTLCLEGSWERADALSSEALEETRRQNDAELMNFALNARHYVLHGPDTLAERLALSQQMLETLQWNARKTWSAQRAHQARLHDLLELGDIDAVEEQGEACFQAALELRNPWWIEIARVYRGTSLLVRGRLEECDPLVSRAITMGQRLGAGTVLGTATPALITLRREQGRLGEVEEHLRALAKTYPNRYVWHSTLAFLYASLGDMDEARSQLERLATHDFRNLPRQRHQCSQAIAWLCETCALLGDARRAESLLALLSPYIPSNLVSWGVYLGSASRYAGLLTATVGRLDEAARHFEAALATHARLGARPWLARTQHDYARMLSSRHEAADRDRALELADEASTTARALGMTALAGATGELRRELSGAPSVRARPPRARA